MCGMTDLGVRATTAIDREGRFLVARGSMSGRELYLTSRAASAEEWKAYKPLYAVRMKMKGAPQWVFQNAQDAAWKQSRGF